MVTLVLKPGKEKAVKRFHHWIFSGAFKNLDEINVADGDLVRVVDTNGNYLATGHFHNGSIAVKLLTFQDEPIDDAFWKRKLDDAFAYRQTLGLPAPELTTCYRLVHAEGDGLPGLVVDVYGEVAVVQCHSVGMHKSLPQIAQAIMACAGGAVKAVYDKSVEVLPGNYAATIRNGFVEGEAAPKPVLENGLQFEVNWMTGQKTGFFLDQRSNRELLSHYCRGKRVLNCFSFTGGFSMYALKGGATLVHSVDTSASAIELCTRNMALNFPGTDRHEAFVEDVLRFLKNCDEYDVVVIDPPAFAKSIAKRHNAVQGYKRLNVAAMRKVAQGGILFTFSCSSVVDRELFYNTIVAAALEVGRKVRVMHHLSQSPDHPVNLYHPEGAYLKGLALQVL